MNEQIKVVSGILVAVVLVADGLMHAYWATGGLWPARDRLSLVQAILNTNNVRTFRPPILIFLVCLLFCGVLLVLAQVHLLGTFGQLLPASLLQLGTLAIAAGLLLRGLACIVWALGLATAKSKQFYQLNLLVYTPLCFVLFVATIAVARF